MRVYYVMENHVGSAILQYTKHSQKDIQTDKQTQILIFLSKTIEKKSFNFQLIFFQAIH